MQKHILRTALLLSLLMAFGKPLLASNVTLIMPGQTDGAPAPLNPNQYRPQPALFKFTNGNSTVYLFGTSEDPIVKGTKWRTNELNRILAHVDRIWFEETPRGLRNPIALSNVIDSRENKDGKRIEDLLSHEEMATLRKVAHEQNFDIDEFSRYHPWFIAELLEQQHYQNWLKKNPKQETEYSNSVEEMIDLLDLGKPILPLFNTPENMLSLSRVSPEDDKAFLMRQVNEMDREYEAPSSVSAWSKGDLNSINKTMEAVRRKTPGVYKRTVFEGNKILLGKITNLLQGNGTEFVGVGVEHLVGPNGLISMMEKAEYKAERLYDTEPPVASDTERKVLLHNKIGLYTPNRMLVSLTPGKNPNEVVLHIFQEATYNGCVQISPLKIKTIKSEETIDINVSGYLRNVPAYAKAENCGPSVKTVTGDIPLSLATLKKYKTSILKLTSPRGHDYYTLAYDNGTLTLAPKAASNVFYPDMKNLALTGL